MTAKSAAVFTSLALAALILHRYRVRRAWERWAAPYVTYGAQQEQERLRELHVGICHFEGPQAQWKPDTEWNPGPPVEDVPDLRCWECMAFEEPTP